VNLTDCQSSKITFINYIDHKQTLYAIWIEKNKHLTTIIGS